MTNSPRSLVAPMMLSAAAMLVATVGLVGFVLIGSIPSESSATIRGITSIAASTVLAAAGVMWWHRVRENDRRSWLLVGLVAAATAAAFLFTLSFSAGMDDGDAGRAISAFGRLSWVFALGAMILAGSGVAVLTSMLLPQTRLSTAGHRLVAIAAGVVMAVPAFLALLSPWTGVFGAAAMLCALLVVAGRAGSPRGPVTDAAAARPAPPSSTGPRAMGILSLGILAVVWGIAAVVGVTQSGRPEATAAMGYGAALASLAAIPLVRALVNGGEQRGYLRRYAAIPVAALVVGTAVSVVWYSPAGQAVFVGAGISGCGVGVWFAAVLVSRLRAPLPVKALVGAAVVVGTVVTWFILVTTSGSIALVIPAIVAIAVGGGSPAPGARIALSDSGSPPRRS